MIEATLAFEDLHVTDAKVWVLLSLKVPVAMRCNVVPMATVEVAGVTAIDTRVRGVSVAGSYSSALAKR